MTDRTGSWNLVLYSDSRAMPRQAAGTDIEHTFPSILQREHLTFFRGWGGITSSEILWLLSRDCNYFGEQKKTAFVFFFGIVDAAPIPITYKLKTLIRLIPHKATRQFCMRKFAVIELNRPKIQRFWSYNRVSRNKFKSNVLGIRNILNQFGYRTLIILNPLTPELLELRSPGLRSSLQAYNEILTSVFQGSINTQVISMENFSELLYVSLADGHHFSNKGHGYIASKILKVF